jgi:MerR family mercuric resistance operon transcriptional regulator
LEEIDNLLHLEEAHCCADTRALAVHKLALIDAKLADLTAMRNALAGLVKHCDSGNQDGECPIIRALVQD